MLKEEWRNSGCIGVWYSPSKLDMNNVAWTVIVLQTKTL